ncbi:MAG TPA: hypothetical protein DDY98_03700 [Ruminococcaceae bacterium]|nr:hypothetical protein [Oscillospiraceae bacterium]
MNTLKQISVFVANKAGRLAFITKCLADAQVNIRAMCMADTTDYGIFRLIVNDCDTAKTALTDAGLTASITEVIGIEVADKPGALAHAVNLLSDADISVEYAYAFNTPDSGLASVILRVSDNKTACDVLQKGNVKLISQAELR